MTNTDFDWLELGEKFWRDAAESCQHKPSEEQLRFACLRWSGMNMSDSAVAAGYSCPDDESARQQGSRADKTTAVSELLAYAHAETGKGSDGLVDGQEARRILSRIARRGNNNERIKSLEALAKIDLAEAAIPKPETSLEEDLAGIICLLPKDAAGAVIAMEAFFNGAGNVLNFPFLKLCAPVVSKLYPNDWKRWRDKSGPHRQWAVETLDRVAAGPVLDDEALVAAVRAKTPRRPNTEVSHD